MMIENPNSDIDAYRSDDNQPYDSDRIDSEIEAELYSTIHHEVVLMKPEDNPTMEQNHSINLISVTDDRVLENECHVLNDPVPANNLCKNVESPLRSEKSNDIQMVKNPNVAVKRKSNLIANILDNIQVNTEMPSKKQKTRNSVLTREPKINFSKNITIEVSDSDSSILTDSDVSNTEKLQTNIEAVFVSSESENSLSSLDESSAFFNSGIIRNNCLGGNGSENSEDPWHINDGDLFHSKKRSSGRYHENAVSKCSKCDKRGHVARYCTEVKVVKCFICGYQHPSFRCNLRICTNCWRSGHIRKSCPYPTYQKVCHMCSMQGHGEKDCPDLWRRFHLTTNEDHVEQGSIVYECHKSIVCELMKKY